MPSKTNILKFARKMIDSRGIKWVYSKTWGDIWHPLSDEEIWEIYKEVCES